MGRCRNKKIWTYFDRLSDYAARCKHCKLQLSCKHTSANLVRHLYYKHHVDASYYGAEKTGFLKQKRVRVNRETITDELKGRALQHTEVPYDPLRVIKHEMGEVDADGLMMLPQTNGDVVECQQQEMEKDSMQSICNIRTSSLDREDEAIVENDPSDYSGADWCQPNGPTIHFETTLQMEKLKAETRYYNEMSELARAKRVMIELQSEKLRLEMETMRTS